LLGVRQKQGVWELKGMEGDKKNRNKEQTQCKLLCRLFCYFGDGLASSQGENHVACSTAVHQSTELN
jgi:hypothetical protein